MIENLINEVKELLDEVHETQRYSMSKITYMYNKVFGTNYPPKSSVSWLIRQVQNLDAWYNGRYIPHKGLCRYDQTNSKKDS